LILYIVLFSLISLVIILLLPPVTHQVQNLTNDFPHYWQRVSSGLSVFEDFSATDAAGENVQDFLKDVGQTLSLSGRGVADTVINVFGGIFSFMVILVITFYFLLEENAIKKILRFTTPAKYQPYFTQLLLKMQEKIGLWLRGQIALSLIIALIVFVGLNIFGIFFPVFAKYALVLALLAFLLEFVPYLGPILAAVPSIFVGVTHSLALAGAVAVFYMVMQWLENNLIVPQVMRRAVGLNPIIVITALMIGARVGGIMGMVLAIPVTTAILVVAEELFKHLEEREG
jgi:predicted PurR-regulated permease PerM